MTNRNNRNLTRIQFVPILCIGFIIVYDDKMLLIGLPFLAISIDLS